MDILAKCLFFFFSTWTWQVHFNQKLRLSLPVLNSFSVTTPYNLLLNFPETRSTTNTYKHIFLLILLHLSFSTVSCILVALHITYRAEESNSIRPFNFIADTLAVTILLAVEKKGGRWGGRWKREPVFFISLNLEKEIRGSLGHQISRASGSPQTNFAFVCQKGSSV